MADAQAAPLLERLKAEPKNPELLTAIGNLYYDAQQYPDAVTYYQRTLEIKPADADVRTDMGTAYWFMGNADSALSEFDKALTYAPNNPNTLFNRGLVEWRGKKDGKAALADWDKLLAQNPAYAQKDAVEKLIAEVTNQPQPASTNVSK
jgi:tetratricopeptide (TPR) repeat protein